VQTVGKHQRGEGEQIQRGHLRSQKIENVCHTRSECARKLMPFKTDVLLLVTMVVSRNLCMSMRLL